MIKTNEKIEERAVEILSKITAFDKDKYDRKSLLEELLKFQEELRNILFNNEHADNADLRIWNVIDHLEKLNKDKGNIAEDELKNIVKQCKCIGNMISVLIAGVAGENKAYFSLQNISHYRKILKNIELSYEDITSELDNIVVTKKGIFLIEVKNIRQDILIDEDGNMYKKEKNDFVYDCNIGEKMNYKEQLLKIAVGKYLKDKKIHSILVFTNSNISVENKYRYIKHIFLGQLPHIIDEYEGNKIYTEVDVENIIESVKLNQSNKVYSPEVDIKRFKGDFAVLLATLEISEVRIPTSVEKPKFNILIAIRNILRRYGERSKNICRASEHLAEVL